MYIHANVQVTSTMNYSPMEDPYEIVSKEHALCPLVQKSQLCLFVSIGSKSTVVWRISDASNKRHLVSEGSLDLYRKDHIVIPKNARGFGFEFSLAENIATGHVTVPLHHEYHNCLYDKVPLEAPSATFAIQGHGYQDESQHYEKIFFFFNKLGFAKMDPDRTVTARWISSQSLLEYETGWMLRGEDYLLDVQATFPEQEHVATYSWIGQVSYKGIFAGKSVSDVGFVCQRVSPLPGVSALLKQVTLLTKEAVDYILPRESSRDAMIAAVASQERSDLIDTIDTDRFNKTLVLPIRDIIDRGGKSWRGLAFLLCIDVVGGNSNKFRTILGSIEILHVGSMIVDDVQDRSSIRRGGPACHVVVGEPLAINAGTFAYFLGIQSALSNVPWLHPKKQLRYYQEYGLVLRAGHFGQALDLSGLDKEMESAVTSGCNKELIHHVLAIHRLKTAVAAGAVARTGAAFGGGTEIQQEYLCAYYESLGTAFQIVDDVLNLSGFSQGQKECGEDISEGKVTYPVAVALSFLKLDDRKRLWMMIRSHPKDDVIRECIDMIRQTGAFDISKKHADEMVEKAWKVLAPIISESKYKTMLFSFGRFVLERWY